VLTWFNATGDYTAIFTLNATGALKHVGECYPFGPDTRLLLTADNHNSVNGIREFAVARRASVEYAGLTFPELPRGRSGARAQLEEGPRGLFAFPAQSNFSGVQHPLSLVERAERSGWHVLLDAAAFVPTNRLDLQAVRPISSPSRSTRCSGTRPVSAACWSATTCCPMLRRPWFAGGTVNFATVQARKHLPSPGEAGYEDGTLQLPRDPGGGDRPSSLVLGRHRSHPRQGPGAGGMDAAATRLAPPFERQGRWSASTVR
jgi:selenocysteine lyase/cysteine desulfurase